MRPNVCADLKGRCLDAGSKLALEAAGHWFCACERGILGPQWWIIRFFEIFLEKGDFLLALLRPL